MTTVEKESTPSYNDNLYHQENLESRNSRQFLKLLWNVDRSITEYTLRYNKTQLGLWQSSTDFENGNKIIN